MAECSRSYARKTFFVPEGNRTEFEFISYAILIHISERFLTMRHKPRYSELLKRYDSSITSISVITICYITLQKLFLKLT